MFPICLNVVAQVIPQHSRGTLKVRCYVHRRVRRVPNAEGASVVGNIWLT